jgi:hypothetical protein
VRVAIRLGRILGEDRCVLIGGLAVGAYGYVRATDDIDVVVGCSLSKAQRLLEAEGIVVRAVRGDVRDGDFPCLKATVEGISVDVLPPLVPLDWERAIQVDTGAGRLRVVDLEGLFRLKLRAQGVQDVLDVAVLVLRHPEYREKAREIAAGYRVLDRLDAFLADRRTQTTATEQKAREERATEPPRRRRRTTRRSRPG